MLSLKLILETLLKVNNTELSIQLLKSLNECLSLVVITMESNGKMEDKKLQESEESLLRLILDKAKSVWTETKKLSWKLIYSMAQTVPGLQRFFPLAEYNEHFAEEMLEILRRGNYQLKSVAASSLCCLLSQNYHTPVKRTCCSKVLLLATSDSCYARITYIVFFKASLEYFSLSFIAEHNLFAPFIKLSDDRVSNVRIHFLKAAKEVTMKLTKDLHKSVITKVKELKNDKDKDVKNIANDIYGDIQNLLNSDEEMQTQLEKDNDKKILHEKELNMIVMYWQTH
eukprot:TRINITY_DN5705_c0_g2_i2.p1 TRINITY_DN5705_c0_g2~~TRINITY_DN5705_c0_g2_i2.p1  ORF type:complete len:284 (+),score=43.98 TRINITY_DN5705_c0_g2_i2:274-1125(+)